MAQTTAAISFANCIVYHSTDGSSWTDISGYVQQITVSGFPRQIGEFYTFTGTGPIIAASKQGSGTVTADVAYTEEAAGPYKKALDAFNNNTNYYLRWLPKGTTTGNYRFTTSAGIVPNQPLPVGDASKGDVTKCSLPIHVGSITQDTAP